MRDVLRLSDRAKRPGRALTDTARCLVGKPSPVRPDEPAEGPGIETRNLGGLILCDHGLARAQTLVIDHDPERTNRTCAGTRVVDFGHRIGIGPKVKAA